MANTGNSAIASTEVFKPTPTLLYPLLVKRLLSKYREPMLFAMGATDKSSEIAGAKTRQVDFKKFGTIPRGGKLLETDKVPLNNISAESVSLTIYEWGNGALMTEAARAWNSIDPLNELMDELAFDARKVHDNAIRDTYYTTTNSKFAGNKAIDTLAAGDKFSFDLMEDLTTLGRTQKMFPFYNSAIGNYFICYISPIHEQQLRQEMLNGDSDGVKAKMWIPVANYRPGLQPLMGEVGMYNNIRFISTPELLQGVDSDATDSYDSDLDPAGAGSSANVKTLTAILTGREGVAWADQKLPGLRFNSEDFDRLQEAAWIAYFGTQLLQAQSVLKIYTSSSVA